MEDCGVFYTSSLHPVYEEIPTPRGQESDYQLLNSEYSTLPFPILPESMVGLLPAAPHDYLLPANDYTKPCDSRHRRPVRHQFGSKTCDKRMKAEGAGTGRLTGRNRGGARTLDTRAACNSATYQAPRGHQGEYRGHQGDYLPRVGCNQADFLPREAWTDFSGSDDWMEGDPLRDPAARISRPRDLSPHRRRLISASASREISPTLNSLESSDVTMSTSSSETYPKCSSQDPGGTLIIEDKPRNLN